MDLSECRASPAERQRTDGLLRLFPSSGEVALDIGARDGYFSLLLTERFDRVIALDLSRPEIEHPQVQCVQGNAAALEFADRSMDFVFCAEVLEHIPPAILATVCQEIERVASAKILIGVPYRQDLRMGRTNCATCGKVNPPWGHVNSFDENRIAALFAACKVDSISFVGITTDQTNAISTRLMELAGHPYGTYDQLEPCIHCGSALAPPPQRNLAQKLATRAAFWARSTTQIFSRPRSNWVHVLLSKKPEIPPVQALRSS